MRKLLALFLIRLLVSSAYADTHLGAVVSAKLNGGIFSVLAYGAKCDGSTDDYPAWSLAYSAAVAAGGGTIVIPASANGCKIDTSPVISADGIQVEGAGWSYTSNAPSKLILAAGVKGFQLTGAGDAIHDLSISSLDSGANNDDCIYVTGGRPALWRILCTHFGRAGVFLDSSTGGNTNHWHMYEIRAFANFGDGFKSAGGNDVNVGVGEVLDASSNGGIGFNLSQADTDTWINTHVSQNAGGGYLLDSTQGQKFINAYCEGGIGSTFTLTSNTTWSDIEIAHFGQCATITNNGSGKSSNTIHFAGIYEMLTNFGLGPQNPAETVPSNEYYIGEAGGTGDYNLYFQNGLHGTWMSYDFPNSNLKMGAGNGIDLNNNVLKNASAFGANNIFPSMYSCGNTATCSGNAIRGFKMLSGSIAIMSGGTITVTIPHGFYVTSFACLATDIGATPSAAGAVQGTLTTILVQGTNGHTIDYWCLGS